MPDSQVFDMPVDASLKLMTVIGSHSMNAEGERFNDVIDELDGALLIMRGIDL